jgi:hypothetical protein
MAKKKTAAAKKSAAKKSASQTAEDREYARAEKVLKKNWRRLLDRKGVTLVDVNYRIRDGEQTPEVVIRVHVQKKVDPEDLRPNQILTEIEGVPIDVVESQNTFKELIGPIQGGARIAPTHNLSEAGTMGIVCFTKGSREPRLLTNAHVVYGGKNKSSLGSRIPMHWVPKSAASTALGDGLRDSSFRDSRGDAALIEPASDITTLPGVEDILSNPTGIRQLTRTDVFRRVVVKKMGAHTGVTEGIVDSITLTFSVPGISYLGQIGIRSVSGEQFSTFGDSGAVVVQGTDIVGLLHGVTDNGKLAIACHMPRVASILGIEL